MSKEPKTRKYSINVYMNIKLLFNSRMEYNIWIPENKTVALEIEKAFVFNRRMHVI